MTLSQLLLLLLVFLQAHTVVIAVAEDANVEEVAEEEPPPWLEAMSELGPYLAGIFIDLFLAHLLVFSDFATRQLMSQYRLEGLQVQGWALSSHLYGKRILVEVMYEANEHKYADNPSLKFRNPDAYERKRFLRTFEFHREIDRGSQVEVLVPPGWNGTRSGVPTEVVDRTYEAFSTVKVASILSAFSILLVVLLYLSIQKVQAMENPSTGLVVLVAGIGLGESISFLYSADQFLKSKRRRFDSALPVVNREEQRLAQENNNNNHSTATTAVKDDPFRIPLHEFAGHARASERGRLA